MKLTLREQFGLVLLIAMFLIGGTILAYTVKSSSNSRNTFQNNPIIEQRMDNIKKQR